MSVFTWHLRPLINLIIPISAGTSALKVRFPCIFLTKGFKIDMIDVFQGDFTRYRPKQGVLDNESNHFIRTGKRDLSGMLNDGVNSLAR